MSLLARSLRRLCEDLAAAKRDVALVGGLAVSVRCEPRFTRDADVVVTVDDDEDAEALVRELQEKGYSVVAMVEQEAVGRLASVRLEPPRILRPGVVVDLLFASSGIEREIARSAEVTPVLQGIAPSSSGFRDHR
jgi:hypothetical protein